MLCSDDSICSLCVNCDVISVMCGGRYLYIFVLTFQHSPFPVRIARS